MAVNVQAAAEAQVFGANMTGMVSKTTDTKHPAARLIYPLPRCKRQA